jgi:hypothetical protein
MAQFWRQNKSIGVGTQINEDLKGEGAHNLENKDAS